MRHLTIGRLAAAAGVNLETVRYYERIGLMASPPRTESGHRAYEDLHVSRLIFVRRARELGFSIEEIRSLLSLMESPRASCSKVKNIAGPHLEEVRKKIVDLNRLEAVLSMAVSRCSDAPDSPCYLLDMLSALGPRELERE